MSIETLLTLALAAGILVSAVVLRFVILGIARLLAHLSGREMALRKTPRKRRQRPSREPIWPHIAGGARSLGAASAFVAGAVVKGVRIAATGLVTITVVVVASTVQGVRGMATSLGPRIGAGGQTSWRGMASAWAWLKPRLVVAVATAQHLGRASAQRTRDWVSQQQEERSARPGEPTSGGHGPRVIELNDDWDPLTDEFPEERLTPSR